MLTFRLCTNGDLFAELVFPFEHGDFENPFFELRLHLFRIDVDGKGESTGKRPICSLHTVELLLGHRLFETPLAFNRDAIVAYAKLNTVLVDLGKLCFEDDTLVGLVEINSRRPGPSI